MSRSSQSSSRGHIYGLTSSGDYDKHMERIIDHASNLFPERQYQLPQIFTPSNSHWNGEGSSDEFRQIRDDSALYGGLDGLGMSVCYLHAIY
jgi:hypothetical protein